MRKLFFIISILVSTTMAMQAQNKLGYFIEDNIQIGVKQHGMTTVMDNLLVGIGAEVVGTQQQKDFLRVEAVQLAMGDAPQAVLNAVPAAALIVDDLPFEQFVPALAVGSPLGWVLARIVAPEMRNGIAEKHNLGRFFTIASENKLMALTPVIPVALLRAGGKGLVAVTLFGEDLGELADIGVGILSHT